jgi:ubiquinone/menaquinone biosynthesis C-methylase UbiE
MSFDRIAPVYDFLSRAVYGKSMVDSQIYFLKRIPAMSRVLIMGGGTGWIVKELFAINRTCSVVYVEASQKMIEQSKQKIHPEDFSRIEFLQQTDIPSHERYDVVLTNFFLDLFPEDKLVSVVKQLGSTMKDDGFWIVTDFVNERKLWQRFLLATMYIFFHVVSKIEATSLPSWKEHLHAEGLQVKEQQKFYGNFIASILYTR